MSPLYSTLMSSILIIIIIINLSRAGIIILYYYKMRAGMLTRPVVPRTSPAHRGSATTPQLPARSACAMFEIQTVFVDPYLFTIVMDEIWSAPKSRSENDLSTMSPVSNIDSVDSVGGDLIYKIGDTGRDSQQLSVTLSVSPSDSQYTIVLPLSAPNDWTSAPSNPRVLHIKFSLHNVLAHAHIFVLCAEVVANALIFLRGPDSRFS